MDRFWKIIERSGLIVGTVCAVITAIFTIAMFYGWDKPSPATQAAPIMIAPWLLYAFGGIAIALLIAACAMMVIRSHTAQPIAFIAPILPQRIPTRLRLQFNGEGALPILVDEQNIWRYYAMAQVNLFIKTRPT